MAEGPILEGEGGGEVAPPSIPPIPPLPEGGGDGGAISIRRMARPAQGRPRVYPAVVETAGTPVKFGPLPCPTGKFTVQPRTTNTGDVYFADRRAEALNVNSRITLANNAAPLSIAATVAEFWVDAANNGDALEVIIEMPDARG